MKPSQGDTITFRELRDDDEEFLWEMLRLAIFTPSGEPPASAEILNEPAVRRAVHGWKRDGDFGVMVSVGSQPSGAAWARFFSKEDPGYGFVSQDIPELVIALQPQLRGRGLGGELLKRLLGQARERAPGISLSVAEENPALRLYRRFGFEVVSRRGESLVMLLSWRSDSEP